ncbi:ATP-binding protein [Gracilibacillus salitolerans]|nr:ATP-binding protein [Gracilibacillus salitolerans]
MQSIGEVIGRLIKKVDEYICKDCGATVPVYERTDQDGNKQTHSICMACDTQKKILDKLPKSEIDLGKYKLNSWIYKQEHIEESIKHASFSNYHPRTTLQHEAKRLAIGYVKKFDELLNKHSIVFKGDVGIGKSHLSFSIGQALKEQGKTVLFITAPALMDAIRALYKDNSMTQQKFMQLIADLDLLILDDIGAEYVKIDPNGFETWAADILFQVVNIRQSKPTIYSTNYSSAEMEQKYGRQSKRILSRMLSGAEAIKIDGEDQRVQAL